MCVSISGYSTILYLRTKCTKYRNPYRNFRVATRIFESTMSQLILFTFTTRILRTALIYCTIPVEIIRRSEIGMIQKLGSIPRITVHFFLFRRHSSLDSVHSFFLPETHNDCLLRSDNIVVRQFPVGLRSECTSENSNDYDVNTAPKYKEGIGHKENTLPGFPLARSRANEVCYHMLVQNVLVSTMLVSYLLHLFNHIKISPLAQKTNQTIFTSSTMLRCVKTPSPVAISTMLFDSSMSMASKSKVRGFGVVSVG